EVAFGGEGKCYFDLHRPSILTHAARVVALRDGYPDVTQGCPKGCRAAPALLPSFGKAPVKATWRAGGKGKRHYE
ncbi:MAG: hypothetical protein M3P49_17170, partial [Actinomycetota bacterium]|nr:hypothetical protein [Actinomycetota bacterium]